MPDTYPFRRDDTGELIEVDFATMLQAEGPLGILTLPCGATARRVRTGDTMSPRAGTASDVDRPIVSDALGFIGEQLADFEADRVRHGFSGIEFRPDPRVPQFYQAHASSRAEFERYARHRGKQDNNSRNGSGVTLTEGDLKRAAQLVSRGRPE